MPTMSTVCWYRRGTEDWLVTGTKANRLAAERLYAVRQPATHWPADSAPANPHMEPAKRRPRESEQRTDRLVAGVDARCGRLMISSRWAMRMARRTAIEPISNQMGSSMRAFRKGDGIVESLSPA